MRSFTLRILIVTLAWSCVSSSQNTNTPFGIESSSNKGSQPSSTVRLQSGLTSIAHAQLLDQHNWLVADTNQLYKSTNGGQIWDVAYKDENQDIRSVSFVDAQTGFLLTGKNLFRTTNGANSWQKVSEFDSLSEQGFIENIHFVDSKHGWAVGLVWQEDFLREAAVSQYRGAVFATRDGGKTWMQQKLIIPSEYFERSVRWSLNDVYFKNATNGWVVGDGVILWTKDGGNTWNLAEAKRRIYTRIHFLNENLGWATEKNNTEFAVTTNGGRRWKLLKGPPAYGNWPMSLSFITRQHGFSALLSLYETKDAGETWTRISGGNDLDQPQYDFIGNTKDGSLIVLGLHNGIITSLVSTDKGTTWITKN